MMDTDPTRPDLSLVDTEHLIAEIVGRCDAIAIAIKPKANPEEKVRLETHGSWYTTLGMVAQLHHGMLHDNMGDDEEDDDMLAD